MRNRTEILFGSEAGFVSGDLYKVPNRRFVPSIVHSMACQGQNLQFLGLHTDSIVAGGAGLCESHAFHATLSEYCERYSAACYGPGKFLYGTYRQICERHACLNPDAVKLYADWQHSSPDFPIARFTAESPVNWVKAKRIIDGEDIYVPAFLVFMPYVTSGKDSNYYMLSTSTGLSSAPNVETAIVQGFLETVERHAFSYFWYLQGTRIWPMYSQESILDEFGATREIHLLFHNPQVKIVAFDLSDFLGIEVMITFMFYAYRRKIFQSVGAAARFNKKEALVKSCLEAYQGIEFGISLSGNNLFGNALAPDLDAIDSFEKHFAFYNTFPGLRDEVPILAKAQHENKYDTIVSRQSRRSMQELMRSDKDYLRDAFYCTITPSDVRSLGYEVVRVCVPSFSYLTGYHRYPFFGNPLFASEKNLFTALPHPFP